jgi:hypothetical protein
MNIPRFFFSLWEEFDELFQDFKIIEPELLLSILPLKADVENAPENLQMELINLQCHTNLTQKSSETDFQDFYSYLPKYKIHVLRSFGLRMIAMFGSTYACEQFFLLWTIIGRKADLVWQTDTWNLSWHRSAVISHRGYKSSPGPNDAKSPANLRSSWGEIWPGSSLVIFVAQNPKDFPR